MTEVHDLQRFVTAQEPIFETALAELRAGRKRTHWMWFVFPQLRGLGLSPTAERYGLASLAEARAYLAHPVLGPRLVACTAAILEIEGQSAHAIFGSPDDMKLRSSLTLFALASCSGDTLFQQGLQRYFDGKPDQRTLDLIGSRSENWPPEP
ncbi:DUF1810 domain-containing protein [Bosea sp. BIWAKO-01]|uniref:DUF1810 domain-containing protein n=1 Tax=Bosea sp. BIWAKO-01 TaxID=506668 RepID=UPI000853D6A8|nr:DUF1810 domain-containing protein [Bosea sp. BIWAKO-01]GAU82360.1 NTP pyrophosphohydrolases including oxidative damage repair enzymes [Bosea sp. BIWAKO-01]